MARLQLSSWHRLQHRATRQCASKQTGPRRQLIASIGIYRPEILGLDRSVRWPSSNPALAKHERRARHMRSCEASRSGHYGLDVLWRIEVEEFLRSLS